MKILITGICGFVGSCIARELKVHRNDIEIIGIDNFSRIGSANNIAELQKLGISVIHGDIRNSSDIEFITNLDWIIDCAAEPSVLAGLDGSSKKLMENNLFGTINLLELCKKFQAGFTLLSTSRVYSCLELANLEILEDATRFVLNSDSQLPKGLTANGADETFSTTPPLSLYGTSKLTSELIAREYAEAFNFPVYINRCGLMAGKGQFGKADQGIVGFWINSWKKQLPLKYIGFNGSGKQVRDCLHPQDLIPLLWKQFENTDESKPKVLNISGGIENTFSLKELSDWCSEHIGIKEINIEKNNRSYDAPWIVLDSSKAKDAWNWKPMTPITKIFQEIKDS